MDRIGIAIHSQWRHNTGHKYQQSTSIYAKELRKIVPLSEIESQIYKLFIYLFQF